MNLKDIPDICGVYLFRDSSLKIIYIGKAKRLRSRVTQYFSKSALQNWKTANIQILVKEIDFIPCTSEREALVIERQLINRYQPFFNVLWKDSKTYPYIKITSEDFPRILLTRKKLNDGADYFGPYPKVDVIRNIFRTIQSIKLINLRKCNFSFSKKQSLDIRKRLHCIYYHTGQCPSPCDSQKITWSEYNMIVKRAKAFFGGKYMKLALDLKKQMQRYSNEYNYEKAALCRDFLKAIEHISERVLVRKIDINELESRFEFINIAEFLKEKFSLSKLPVHIEAFDTSSLFGRYCVGASVCFINGEANYSDYRHYKIKYKNLVLGSNDFAMIYEIVYRRLKKIKDGEESLPDLFIIDGGRGQLNAALKAARKLAVKMDFIAIAKKNEEIYLSSKTTPVLLEKDNPALNFLRKIRDEVHRFAIKYHRKSREKILEYRKKGK